MNFYIKSIKLWFKSNVPDKVYEFKPNKVNVVTGDSSTGKSSILSIIDYCLLSGTSNIVENVINENVEWYGLSFHVNDSNYIIIRKCPQLEQIDQQIYFDQADDYPAEIIPNATRGGLMVELNQIFNVSPIALSITGAKKDFNISFRSFLPFNYLTEEVMASPSSYFDTKFFRNEELESAITQVFKIAIGIDEQIKDVLQRDFNICENEIKKEKRIKKSLEKRMGSIHDIKGKLEKLNIPIDNGDDATIEEQLTATFTALDEFYANSNQAIETLYGERQKIRATLSNCERLRKSIEQHNEYIKQTADSLSPIEYLKRHTEDTLLCSDSILLMENLNDTFEQLKKRLTKEQIVPQDLLELIENSRNQLRIIESKIKEQNRIAKNSIGPSSLWQISKIRSDFDNLQRGKVKNRTFDEEKYINLLYKSHELEEKLNSISTNLETIRVKLNKSIDYYLEKAEGFSESYSAYKAFFDFDKLRLCLLRGGEHYSTVNIGSQCNRMFMHLCTYLGLHEHILNEKVDYTPSFLFIDQPSIPLYADKNVSDNGNDDKERLDDAFRLINTFMERNVNTQENRNFQIILIEHADPSYWINKYRYFETRYQFVDGLDGGLIPDYVYRRK
jgi:hypothetical protein